MVFLLHRDDEADKLSFDELLEVAGDDRELQGLAILAYRRRIRDIGANFPGAQTQVLTAAQNVQDWVDNMTRDAIINPNDPPQAALTKAKAAIRHFEGLKDQYAFANDPANSLEIRHASRQFKAREKFIRETARTKTEALRASRQARDNWNQENDRLWAQWSAAEEKVAQALDGAIPDSPSDARAAADKLAAQITQHEQKFRVLVKPLQDEHSQLVLALDKEFQAPKTVRTTFKPTVRPSGVDPRRVAASDMTEIEVQKLNTNTDNAATVMGRFTANEVSRQARDHLVWLSNNPRAAYHNGARRADSEINGGYRLGRNDAWTSIAVHELGHHVEYSNPAVMVRAQQFLNKRIREAGTADVNMRDTYGGGYEDHEIGNEDNFWSAFGEGSSAAYVGKKYAQGQTEIISMGVEKLFQDSTEFATVDPEYVLFLRETLQGDNLGVPRRRRATR